MRAFKWTLLVVGAIVFSLLMALIASYVASTRETNVTQSGLDAFYTPPNPIPANPGTLIRSEPLAVEVPGATAYRMLYSTQRPDGTPAVSGGMMFIPDGPAPAGGRKVVAWAHGTVGQGDACTPSRSTNPLQDTTNWLDQMMQFGWVVVSTDYAGMGTPGPNLYLVAQAEVSDVVNSVRAIREFPAAHAGSEYVVWGHSQGGHSSLWSGQLAPNLAPELNLIGVAAAAPAAELTLIMGAQWNTAVGWAIGPEIVESWPVVYPSLPLDGYISPQGQANGARLANECIIAAAIEGLVRIDFGQEFFAVNPTNTDWGVKALEQTPPPLPALMPAFIGQSTADTVVLPWPNAVLQEKWCKAGSMIEMLWIGDVSHQDTATTIGPAAVDWIADRFAGRPPTRTCDVEPPVSPPAGTPIS
jgi:pimeloyl-ACP methyl ester carboxylesterase